MKKIDRYLLLLLIILSGCCSRSNGLYHEYSIHDVWLNLDTLNHQQIATYGLITWVSADRKCVDISDKGESITVYFQVPIDREFKRGSKALINGSVSCKSVQRGMLDRFIHNAFFEGISIRRR